MSIEKIIGYTFKNKYLLEEAFTHPGRAESRNGNAFNYQRLEFLGDAVLGVAVAEMLFRLYPHESEGSLAKRLAALVRSESVAGVARSLNLGEYIRMNASERGIESSLEDACEAMLGAIYLDGGLEVVRELIQRIWEPMARSMPEAPKDAKTALQEWAQAKGLKLPLYTVTETAGSAHAPVFTIRVSVDTGEYAEGTAPSKRQAEQLAAKTLLSRLEV